MATKGTFTLTGLDTYIEALTRAGEDVDERVASVMREAGEEVKAAMREIVPVETGNLQSHIGVEGPHRDGNYIYVEVGVLNADKNTAIYANVVEFGSPRQAARPYFRPAMAKKKSVIRRAMQRVLERHGLSV